VSVDADALAARVDRLESIEAIRALPLRYAAAFDRRDREAFLALWAPSDGTVRLPDLDGAIVAAHLDRFFSHGPSVMVVANHLIELVDADHATGQVHGWPQVRMGEDFVDQMVLYRDTYVRHAGEWRFAVRSHLLLYGQRRAQDPFAQPPADWPRGQIGRGVY
jgi:hypothetical protein